MYDWPASGSDVLTDFDRPVAFASDKVSVPSVDPVVTGTFQVRPLLAVVGVPTVAPVAAAPDSEKFDAATPVTADPKVNVQFTVADRLGVASTRSNDVTETLEPPGMTARPMLSVIVPAALPKRTPSPNVFPAAAVTAPVPAFTFCTSAGAVVLVMKMPVGATANPA